MIVMNVYRNSRNSREDLVRIIENIWNRPGKIVYTDAVGVVLGASESIANSFLFTQSICAENLNVKIHTLSLTFTKDQFHLEQVCRVAQSILLYLGMEYQCFLVVEEGETEYCVWFAINACSYNGASKFADNNQTYIKLREMLGTLIREKVMFIYDKTVLFEDQFDKRDNYVTLPGV